MPVAAVDPEAAELTIGSFIAGMMFLGIMGLSLLAIVYWFQKLATGQRLIPPVAASGIRVRKPVTIFVLSVSLMFCGLGVIGSLVDAEPDKADAADADDQQETDDADQGPQDGDEANAENAAEVTEGEVTEGDATEGDDVAENVTAEDQNPTPQERREQLNRNLGLIIANIVIQIAVFLIIGGCIFLTNMVMAHSETVAVPSVGGDGQAAGDSGPTSVDAPIDTSNPYAATAAVTDPIAYFDQVVNRPAGTPAGANPYDQPEDADPAVNPYAAAQETHGVSGFRADFRYALEAVLVAFLPVFAIRIVTTVIVGDLEAHPFLEMLKSDGGGLLIAAILIGGVIVAPISEELMYRVVLCGGLSRLISSNAAIVVSSILFCLAHGLQDAFGLMPLALVLGYTYQQRKSYVCVVMIHMMFNGFSMIAALVSLL